MRNRNRDKDTNTYNPLLHAPDLDGWPLCMEVEDLPPGPAHCIIIESQVNCRVCRQLLEARKPQPMHRTCQECGAPTLLWQGPRTWCAECLDMDTGQ